jgi:Zn-dependent peptidase ImmA (M78 family)
VSLRRGFKANANRISLRLRKGLTLRPEDPIDLTLIAARLEIATVPLTDFTRECPSEVRQLTVVDRGAFSAATLRIGQRKIIIYNDAHDSGRQMNSVAHEISHVLLGHPLTLPIDASGCRNVDRDIEDQANWLGPTILISNEAAMHIVRTGMDTAEACKLYRVSEPLLRMRLNASGAVIRLRRA